MHVFAQTYPITSINISLPANPDANTANWGTGTSMLIITATRPANSRVDAAVEGSRILVIIKQNGAKICGAYTSSTAPVSDFTGLTKVWSGSNAAGLTGQNCTLKPGDYELSVQFFGYSNAKTIPLSDEKIKPFTIKGNDQQNYQAPQNITPADGTAFKDEDIRKPITFRWTPVIPRPQGPVTYRLKVWQLMQGQTGTQAIKANQPIIIKDVDNMTQAIVTNLITGPCKPPYLCDFVWDVQALNKDGKGYGANNGTSGPTTFNAGEKSATAAIRIDTLTTACVTYGNYSFAVKVENPGNMPFSATSLTFSSAGGGITNVVINPVLPAIINAGSANAVTFTGTFSYTGATYPTTLIAKVTGNQSANPALTSSDTEQDTLKVCLCNDCKGGTIDLKGFSATPDANNNGQFNIAGNVNVSGLPAVYGIEFQVQSYDYAATPVACTNGVTNIAQSGMFLRPGTSINGTTAIQMFNETVSGDPNTNNNAAKDIKLVSASPLPNSIPVALVLGLPAPITGLSKDCCKIKYDLCIKVTVFYDKDACKSCTFNYCFPSFSN